MKKLSLRIVNLGLISIMDQGFFSGTNFFVSLLLARWLSSDDYGTFSVLFSFFLLISGIYVSFLLEPLSIFGSKENHNKHNYFGTILQLHYFLSIIIFIGYLVGYYVGSFSQISTSVIAVFCSPFILNFWLVRRRQYSLLMPKKALIKSMVYSVLSLGILFLFYINHILSSSSYFVILGIASIMICIPDFRYLFSKNKELLFQTITQNWNYGSWIALAGILQWTSTQIYTVWIANLLSLSDTAGFRAIQNFAQPFEQISVGLTQFLLPWFSNELSQKDPKSVYKKLPLVSVAIALVGIVYLITVLLLQNQISDYIYKDRYIDYLWLFPILLSVPIVLSLSQGAQIGTRIMEKSKYLLYAYSLSSIFTLLIGPILINQLGLMGAALGRILSASIYSLSISIIFLYKRYKDLNHGSEKNISTGC
ncbi:MAG: hypothetical protein JEZ00_12920 [Anaerolineaceae bacterium]|nr:hypothetical protein [Anaerolineaceae bacterium]